MPKTKVRYAIKLKSTLVPVYTDKGNRDGFKTLYATVEDVAKVRGFKTKECVEYDPRVHRSCEEYDPNKKQKGITIVHMNDADVKEIFVDEFWDGEDEDEEDFDDYEYEG